MRRDRSYLLDSFLLIGLCLLFFWRDLTPVWADRRSFAAGDFAWQFHAFARYEASRLYAGQLPLWNPYAYAGHPFLADVQAAVFYPLSLLTLALNRLLGNMALPYHALELEALAHFPLAAIGVYLLARRWTGRRTGGLVAAVAFTFSGYLTSYPPLQLAILETQAWLPLILLALDGAAGRLAAGDERAAVRWSLAAGLLLGISCLAGHPQSALLVLYASLGFFLYRLLASWPGSLDLHRVLRRLRWAALFLLVGMGVAAVQWLPSLEFMRLTTRAAMGFDEAGTGFTPYDLLQLILPAVGVPFPALYMGVLPLGLAILALAHRAEQQRAGDRTPHAFLAGFSLLGLLLSFGKHLPVYQLFYLLAPGWGLFRHQERTIVWAVLGITLLAGSGASCLAHPGSEGSTRECRSLRRLIAAYLWAALGALLLALAFFVGYQGGRSELWGFTAATLLLAALLGAAALALRSRQPHWLLAVLILDLFTLVAGNHRGAAIADPFPPLAILAPLQVETTPFRVANEGRLPENYGVAYGVEEIGGASPLKLASLQTFLERVPRARAWKLLNVKYVLTAREELDASAERVAQTAAADGKTTFLYRLADPGARAWLAADVIVEPDPERLWARLAAPDFDPERQIVAPALPAGYVPSTASCAGAIIWRERAPERLALTVTLEQPCILVLSELDYPGWQATVDGQRAEIMRANGLLRAVPLAAGEHAVEMVFRPDSLLWGGALSLGTWLVVGWLLVGRKR